MKCDVLPLPGMENGEGGTAAYLHKGDGSDAIPKLTAAGVLPSRRVGLPQRSLSFLFQLGMNRMAVDGSIAQERRIYMRRGA